MPKHRFIVEVDTNMTWTDTRDFVLDAVATWGGQYFPGNDEQDAESWKFRTRQGWAKLYGGKLTQNVMELLCRVVPRAVLKDDVQEHFERCRYEMERPPAWLPDLPLKVEGGVSERYEK